MKKVFLQPMTVRIWHWVNALSFFVLVATGVQIRYRDIPNLTTFKTAVDVHNFFGFLLIADFLLWLVYYVFTGKIRVYVPMYPKEFIVGALRQMRYYGYGIMIGEKDPHHATPEEKFNPLQQSAYFMVMLILMPLQVVSGILLWDIRMFVGWIEMLGGLRVVDIVHVVAFFLLTAFLFVHVYLTTLGRTPLAHIKAMFTGYEEVEENE